MGDRLPTVSGKEARAVFERVGWVFDRQNGSHMILIKAGIWQNLSVPDHKTLDRGLLRKLIRVAGLSVDEFVDLL